MNLIIMIELFELSVVLVGECWASISEFSIEFCE